MAGATPIGHPQRSIVLTVLLSVTVLQRFALPFADSTIGWGLVLSIIASIWGLFIGVMRIDPARIAIYALAMGSLLITMLCNPYGYSKLSFAMLAVAYFFFVIYLPLRSFQYLDLLRMVQAVIAFTALCGLAQFVISVPGRSGLDVPVRSYLRELLVHTQFQSAHSVE